MKTLKAILLGFITFCLVNINVASEKEKDLMAIQVKYFKLNIGEQLMYPESARKENIEGTVATCVQVQKTGDIIITGINGHPVLIESVKNQLKDIQLPKNSILAGEEILMNIHFNIE